MTYTVARQTSNYRTSALIVLNITLVPVEVLWVLPRSLSQDALYTSFYLFVPEPPRCAGSHMDVCNYIWLFSLADPSHVGFFIRPADRTRKGRVQRLPP